MHWSLRDQRQRFLLLQNELALALKRPTFAADHGNVFLIQSMPDWQMDYRQPAVIHTLVQRRFQEAAMDRRVCGTHPHPGAHTYTHRELKICPAKFNDDHDSLVCVWGGMFQMKLSKVQKRILNMY